MVSIDAMALDGFQSRQHRGDKPPVDLRAANARRLKGVIIS